ncbi:MAG: TonB-dependent hemoglobin/transferrin/lactoferrin family receptor [Pseudohongiella nitratireducens]|nr:TonB-dependent hemoglobin/transferrin/lactoferrin family receptor [Pseudohongiella nitratireducens]MDF1621895.1 TonB-dependent hemoglobin/transferrin/lactoferrin family receptor [Pseudohongiella nitratireducens]
MNTRYLSASTLRTLPPKLALAQAIAMLIATGAHAQSVQELDLTTVEAESIERDAVVEVITADDINAEMVDNFEDLVRFIPHVSVSRGDDRWGASGFNIRGLDEDRVAINVDGVPQGETLKYEGGQAYGYFKGSRNGVDIEALKAVEIVKGADAILSGNGSLAGAVNMTTKDPADFLTDQGNDSGFAVKTGYTGLNDEMMASFSAANRTGKLESLLVYTRREDHEFENYDMDGLDVDGAGRETPDPQDNQLDSALVKFIYDLTPNSEIGLVGSYYERNANTDNRSFNGGWYSDRVGDDFNETKRVGIFYNLDMQTAFFDSVVTALNDQNVLMEANTHQEVNIQIPGFPNFNTNERRISTRAYEQDLLQLTVDFNKAVADHSLVYGLEVQDKAFKNTQIRQSDNLLDDSDEWVTSNIGALVPASEADVYTLYGLDTFYLGDNTQMRLGLRYDDYTYDAEADENFSDDTATLGEVSFDAVTWTVGVEQGLSNTLSLEAGVSTGFRAPTIEDMYSISGTFDDWNTVPNADLEAEYSTNFDIALVGEYAAGDVRIGAFRSNYDDFIDYQTVNGTNTNTGLPDPDGYLVPFNSNDVEMQGLEFSANIDLNAAIGAAQGLTMSFSAAYTDGEEANGDPVYSVQPLNAVWRTGYTSPTGKWGASLVTTYNEGKANDDSYDTDATGTRVYPLYLSNTATLFDLMVYVDLLENLRLTAGAFNLTDKEYYTWDSVRFIDQGDLRPGIGVTGNGIRRYSEPGRSFEVNLNLTF